MTGLLSFGKRRFRDSAGPLCGVLLSLCAPGLACAHESVSTAALVPVEAAPKPAYFGSVTDPAFGQAITRSTDPGVWPCRKSYCRHHYSSAAAWNADGSLLVINKGADPWEFLAADGKSVRFLRDPVGDCEWLPSDAAEMLCLRGNAVLLWSVRANTTTTAYAVPAGYRGVAFGPDKRAISRDGRSVALRATRGDGRRVAFVVDLSARRKYPDIDLSALAGGNSYVAISPLGDLVWIYQGNDTSYVFTREGGQLQHWTENHCPGHGDMTVDAAGDEWFVGVCKAAPYEAHVVERQLRTGRIVDLTQGLATVASHVSTRNTGLPGWAFVTFSADYGAAADGAHANPWGECDALKLDGSGELRRVAQTHSTETWYVAEAHCSPSPNGSRVVFASDWGQATGGGIAAYVVAVPW